MIRIQFNPDKDLTPAQQTWWDAWKIKANNATLDAIRAWEKELMTPPAAAPADPDDTESKFKFEERVWKDLRDWLLKEVFHGKCAYCETKVRRQKYDTDHFRPKADVNFRADDKTTRYIRGMVASEWRLESSQRAASVRHPGYFWLAYHWKNLLPACKMCNAINGKKNQFPINKSYVAVKRVDHSHVASLKQQMIKSQTWEDIYYLQPDDLDELEEPLLLHPYDAESPREHLKFTEQGRAVPRDHSEKGAWSIQVYDLNDPDLVKARRNEQLRAANEYLSAMIGGEAPTATRMARAERRVSKYRTGEGEYSAAVWEHLERVLKALGGLGPGPE